MCFIVNHLVLTILDIVPGGLIPYVWYGGERLELVACKISAEQSGQLGERTDPKTASLLGEALSEAFLGLRSSLIPSYTRGSLR